KVRLDEFRLRDIRFPLADGERIVDAPELVDIDAGFFFQLLDALRGLFFLLKELLQLRLDEVVLAKKRWNRLPAFLELFHELLEFFLFLDHEVIENLLALEEELRRTIRVFLDLQGKGVNRLAVERDGLERGFHLALALLHFGLELLLLF